MYIHGEFPNFFLPIGRVCGVEIPLTRWRKPAGSVLATWQFKPMTPELEEELVRLLADLLADHLRAHPPTNHEEAPQVTSPPRSPVQPGRERSRRRPKMQP